VIYEGRLTDGGRNCTETSQGGVKTENIEKPWPINFGNLELSRRIRRVPVQSENTPAIYLIAANDERLLFLDMSIQIRFQIPSDETIVWIGIST
jgi:hypothetical protein